MLFSVDLHIFPPVELLLVTIVEGTSELGLLCTGHISHIVGPKEVVKQEHVSLPSIPGSQSRLDVEKAIVLATNIGHNVPNIMHVIQKGSSRVRRSHSHFSVHSIIPFCRVLSFWFDLNIRPHNIIQFSPSSSILGSELLLDCFKSSRPVLVVYHWLLCCLIEINIMLLMIAVPMNQNQVD
jgi:hypothetical protein